VGGGGQLGRPSGARFKTYERLKRYVNEYGGTLFVTQDLLKAIDNLYKYPLTQMATDSLNRQIRMGIQDAALAEMVNSFNTEGRLCQILEEQQKTKPQIICSLGLKAKES
jgi:hypothetical protein